MKPEGLEIISSRSGILTARIGWGSLPSAFTVGRCLHQKNGRLAYARRPPQSTDRLYVKTLSRKRS